MAASVFESLTIPRPRIRFIVPASPRAAADHVPSPLLCRRSPPLPETRGLRIVWRPPMAAPAAGPASGGLVRRRAVVCEAQGTATEATVPDVTKTTWQSLVMDSDIPVVVEFWASWCGPCRMIHPVIAKLSKAYEGKLTFYKLNTDENPDIATQYGIRSIPTILIFRSGEKKDTVIGAVPEGTLVTCIEKFL